MGDHGMPHPADGVVGNVKGPRLKSVEETLRERQAEARPATADPATDKTGAEGEGPKPSEPNPAREAPEAESWTAFYDGHGCLAISGIKAHELPVTVVPESRALKAEAEVERQEARVRELEEALGKVAFLEAARRALSSPPEEGTG